MRIIRLVFAATLCAVLSACNAVESRRLLDGASNANGEWSRGYAYSLVKAEFLISVVARPDSAKFTVCLSDPVPAEDDTRFVLRHRNSPLSADRLSVSYHTGSNRLRNVTLTAIDQTDKFIINLAGAAGSLSVFPQNAQVSLCTPGEDAVALATMTLDPTSAEKVQSRMRMVNKVIYEFALRAWKRCKNSQSETGQSYSWDVCQEYRRICSKRFSERWPISMHWDRPQNNFRQPPKGYCETGICYRPLLRHTVYMGFAGSTVFSQAFHIPNNSPALAFDVTRGVAIKKVTNVTFDELGQPTTVKIDKGDENGENGAELVQLALVPTAAVNQFFTSMSGTLDVVTTAFADKAELLDKKIALFNKKQELAEKRRELIVQQQNAQNKKQIPFVMSVSNPVVSQRPARTSDASNAGSAIRPTQTSSSVANGLENAASGDPDKPSQPIRN